MSKTAFVIILEKGKVRKPMCKPSRPMRAAKVYRRKEKHRKRTWED